MARRPPELGTIVPIGSYQVIDTATHPDRAVWRTVARGPETPAALAAAQAAAGPDAFLWFRDEHGRRPTR